MVMGCCIFQCLGNHEFDQGVEDLRQFVHNVSVPVVSSNLDMSGEPLLADEPNLTKSKVLTVNGRRIGVIGYLTPETSVSSVPINPASMNRITYIPCSVVTQGTEIRLETYISIETRLVYLLGT